MPNTTHGTIRKKQTNCKETEKKIQGKVNLAKHLEDNPEEYAEFENNIFSLVGIER